MDTIFIDLTASFGQNSFVTSDIIVVESDESFDVPVEDQNVKKLKSNRPQKTNNKSRNKIKSSTNKEKEGINLGDCPICCINLGCNQLASTKCGHVYCLKCLEQCLKVDKKCPTCRCILKGNSAYHPLYLNIS